MGERQRQKMYTQADGGLHIDLSLTHVVIPYSRPNIFASLMRGSQLGSARRPLGPRPLWVLAGHSLNLLIDQLTDCNSL